MRIFGQEVVIFQPEVGQEVLKNRKFEVFNWSEGSAEAHNIAQKLIFGPSDRGKMIHSFLFRRTSIQEHRASNFLKVKNILRTFLASNFPFTA